MTDVADVTRVCRGCKRVKPLAAFYAQKAGRNGYNARCKQCVIVREKEYRYRETRFCPICEKAFYLSAKQRVYCGLKCAREAADRRERARPPRPKQVSGQGSTRLEVCNREGCGVTCPTAHEMFVHKRTKHSDLERELPPELASLLPSTMGGLNL